MGEVEIFVRLKYFSPFDINQIPESVLKQVHFAALGISYDKSSAGTNSITIQETLTLLCDSMDLERGRRKTLIEYHTLLDKL